MSAAKFVILNLGCLINVNMWSPSPRIVLHGHFLKHFTLVQELIHHISTEISIAHTHSVIQCNTKFFFLPKCCILSNIAHCCVIFGHLFTIYEEE